MGTVNIPDSVGFCTYYGKDRFNWYCFPHAVLRALEGENVFAKLGTGSPLGCDDCLNFGKPQAHELSSLRSR